MLRKRPFLFLLPPEVSGALDDVAESSTRLVHLGNGRYYDPEIGRPLQPSNAGAVLLEAGFQIAADVNEPFLTSDQRIVRASFAGAEGGTAALAGISINYALGTTAVYTALGLSGLPGWATGAAIATGVGIGFAYGQYVKPLIYDAFGLNPSRTLQPLQIGN